MNRQQLPRIRLKVATNAGINILCTALRTWKVVQWLPYIEQAYRQVKEDQQDDEDSKKRFIKAIRIKKGNFYIANSELIGDIFQDNDEVQCEITFPQISEKKKKKKEKIIAKDQEKLNTKPKQTIQHKDQAIQDREVKNDPINEITEKIKTQKVEIPKKEQKKQKEHKQAKPKKEVRREQKKNQAKKTIYQKQTQKPVQKESQSKEELMNRIDFGKLKSLISHAQESKGKKQVKKVSVQSESQEQLNQSQSD